MLNKIQNKKGASLLEFGILVALVGTVSIVSVGKLGEKVESIFSKSSNALAVVADEPQDLTVQGNAEAFTVSGTSHMTPATGETRAITIRNTMSTPTEEVVTILVNGDHFDIIANSCEGAVLQPNQTCSVTLESRSDRNGTFQDALRVYY